MVTPEQIESVVIGGKRMTLDGDPILTPKQVAELMQVNLRTVYNLINRQELTAKKVGRVWRIYESAVHEYMQGEDPGEK